MASENSLSLLRASLIFFLVSLMLGATAMYVQFGIISALVVWSYKWKELRKTIPSIIEAARPAWVMLFLFAIIFALTLLASNIVSIGQMGELKWLSFPLVFALAFNTNLRITDLRSIEKIALLFLLIISVYSTIDSVYQVVAGKKFGRLFLFDDTALTGKRGSGLLQNPIPFAHVVGSLFHIAIVGAMIARSIGKRKVAAISAGLALLFFACLLTSLARGAWLAVALTGIFSLAIMPTAFRKINVFGLGTATLIGGITLAFNAPLLKRFLSSFDPTVTSNSVRLDLWKSNLKMLCDHPFGIGFNGNDILLPQKLAELGYPATSFQSHPHNEFIDYAVATGFPGMLLYIGVTIWLLVFTVKLLRRATLNGTNGEVFLLTSSALVQSFLNACALTDQFTTPGRFLICLAWAVPMAIALRYKNAAAAQS